MGWFDGDDDDDDDEEDNSSHKRKRQGLLDIHSSSISIATATAGGDPPSTKNKNMNRPFTTTFLSSDHDGKPSPPSSMDKQQLDKKNNDHDAQEEEEDPLDAYMTSLAKDAAAEQASKNNDDNSTNQETTPPTRAERLDVENEDEATTHWEQHHQQHPSLSFPEEPPPQERCTRSPSSSSSSANKNPIKNDCRQVDIRLDHTDHAQQSYAPFVRCLYDFAQTPPPTTTTTSSSSQEDYDTRWRRQHSISCRPHAVSPIHSFEDLPAPLLSSVLYDWLTQQQQVVTPTLVQSQTLPVALAGYHAIVTASTGSGKTLSYLLPAMAHLHHNPNSRALVLVPTRELALQVEGVARSMLKGSKKFGAMAITGGKLGRYQLSQSLLKQKPNVVIATPGRLLDVLKTTPKKHQGWFLPHITFLVLDEADKMLAMGFAPQVTQLLATIRPDRQSLWTSATCSNSMEKRIHQWIGVNHHDKKDVVIRIAIGKTGHSSEHVQQHVMVLPTVQAKEAFLQDSLATFCHVGPTVVFCATRQGCERLGQRLQHCFAAAANHNNASHQKNNHSGGSSSILSLQTLHGDKHPSDREKALRAFVKGQVQVLIATDVAGRGLDIPQVATVINFDPAKNWDTHVHRVGRAGRLKAGGAQGGSHQQGSAYTLLLPSNQRFAETMVAAYQREGRDVPPELSQLANSKRSRTTANPSRNNGSSTGTSHTKRSHYSPQEAADSSLSAYMPSSSSPSMKKHRWA